MNTADDCSLIRPVPALYKAVFRGVFLLRRLSDHQISDGIISVYGNRKSCLAEGLEIVLTFYFCRLLKTFANSLDPNRLTL